MARRLAESFPATNAGLTYRATSFRDIYTGDVSAYLLLVMGAAAFVLLIACANVVNLLLSRGLSREREIAVRVALGAGRSAIVRQLLTESTVLAIASAGVGLAFAYWCMTLLRTLIGARLPAWMSVDIDGRVLAFTVVVSIVAGIVSGLAPALQVYREVVRRIAEGRRSRQPRWQNRGASARLDDCDGGRPRGRAAGRCRRADARIPRPAVAGKGIPRRFHRDFPHRSRV